MKRARLPSSPVHPSTRLIFLVRHGETAFNTERRFQGHLDVPLNKRGVQQAERAARVLARSFGRSQHDRQIALHTVRSSDLSRALQTAGIITDLFHTSASHLGLKRIQSDTRLREFHMGNLQGFTWSEYELARPEEAHRYLKAFENDPLNTSYPGPEGESPIDVQQRVGALLRDSGLEQHQPKKSRCCPPLPPWTEHQHWRDVAAEIWVSHGGTIRMILDLTRVSANPSVRIGNADVLTLAGCKDCGSFGLLAHVRG